MNREAFWRRPAAVLVLVAVIVAVVLVVSHKNGGGQSKPSAGGAWWSAENVGLLETEFPSRLQDAVGIAAPIDASAATCSRTSTQGVYNCTVDTEYDDQIAYYVTVYNNGSWVATLNSGQTYDASKYPHSFPSGPNT